jgi:tetratricopeptide (TPR) repeat protein
VIASSIIAAFVVAATPVAGQELPERLLSLSSKEVDVASTAARLFDFLDKAEATHPNYGRAQLALANALLRLGYTQASAVWLARIATERTDPSTVPDALGLLLSLFNQPHDEVLESQVLGSLDVAALPPKVAARIHLTQGLIDLKAERESWAKAHFAVLPAGSEEHALARHALLLRRVKRGESAAKLLPLFRAFALDQSVPPPVRLESQLAVARLEYEAKAFEQALESYRAVKLPALDPGRPALYLEEAWTRYQLGQYEAAMGVLVTLDAPSFQDAFLPDKYLLQAQIYMDKCHYLPARRAARGLLRRFAGTLDTIRARGDLTEQDVLLRAALAKGPAQRAHAHWELVQRERDQLSKEGPSLGAGLHAHLRAVYGVAFAEATRLRDTRLTTALELEANRLLDAAEQVRLVEYEVGIKLNARIGSKPNDLVPESQDALGPEDVRYRFSGEYWNDELRDIRIKLDDRCREGETP